MSAGVDTVKMPLRVPVNKVKFNYSVGPCKIKLIFRGLHTDSFINEMQGDACFENISLKVTKGVIDSKNEKVIEDKHSMGTLNWEQFGETEGYAYELENTYKEGNYFFKIKSEKNSVFFMKNYYFFRNENEPKVNRLQSDMLLLGNNHFDEQYIQEVEGEDYIFIVVEMGLNININCNMEGASEGMIYQKDKRESLLVPPDYKSGEYKKDSAQYSNQSISRGDNIFDHFAKDEDGSIGFKAVNYRRDVYTGKNHLLNGSTFETETLDTFYHTESIDSKIFILLEVQNKSYRLFANKSEFIPLKRGVNTIKEFKIKHNREITTYIKDLNKQQLIFVHLLFDGTKINFKEMAIDNVCFTNNGKVEEIHT